MFPQMCTPSSPSSVEVEHARAACLSIAESPRQLGASAAPSLAALMRRRYSDSITTSLLLHRAVCAEAGALGAWGADALRANALSSVKCLDEDAEAWKVTGEQLLAHAVLCEAAAGEGASGIASADAITCLLSRAGAHVPAQGWWHAVSGHPSVTACVNASTRVRDGIAPSQCSLTGLGAQFYLCDDAEAAASHNVAVMTLRDGCGDVINDVAPEDVSVALSCGAVTSLMCVGDGLVQVAYSVPAGTTCAVTLTATVYAMPVLACIIQVSAVCCVLCVLGCVSSEWKDELLCAGLRACLGVPYCVLPAAPYCLPIVCVCVSVCVTAVRHTMGQRHPAAGGRRGPLGVCEGFGCMGAWSTILPTVPGQPGRHDCARLSLRV